MYKNKKQIDFIYESLNKKLRVYYNKRYKKIVSSNDAKKIQFHYYENFVFKGHDETVGIQVKTKNYISKVIPFSKFKFEDYL